MALSWAHALAPHRATERQTVAAAVYGTIKVILH
jgi:hypothetical protein